MKAVLELFVRSLTEREPGSKGPEAHQDLGAFLCWLLERHRYRVLRRVFRYEGPERRLVSGVREDGVDIVAARPEADGAAERVYRFVLKTGPVGAEPRDWSPEVPGSMLSDLRRASRHQPSRDSQHDPASTAGFSGVTIVAVHNGDVLTDKVGADIEHGVASIRRDLADGDELAWWNAAKLVDLALEPVVDGPLLSEQADADVFPPMTRPFVRLAFDSLARAEDGAAFDLGAVALLLDAALPLDEPPSPRRLRCRAAELALFVEMLAVESRRRARGNTLPVLDTCERVLCRVMAHADSADRIDHGLLAVIDAVLDRYTWAAEALADSLRPLAASRNGLAWPLLSEPVDYPLRTLRLSGYLAVAGLIHLDRTKRTEAEALARLLIELWDHNPGGALTPVIDDQLIELCLVWELWLRLDLTEAAATLTWRLLDRLGDRYTFGLPLPCVYASAVLPHDPRALEPLARAWFHRRESAWPRFDDRASTIVPAALVVALRGTQHPITRADALLALFTGDASRPMFPQTWQPPDDAPRTWYRRAIRAAGDTRVHRLELGATALVADVYDLVRRCEESAAERWGRPVIDRIAWKTHRTPPPLVVLLPHAETLSER